MIGKKIKPRNYRKCPHCHYIHDGGLDICPRCGQRSEGLLLDTRFPNVIQIHFLKQLFLFLLGWAGISVLALILNWIYELYAQAAIPSLEIRDAFLHSSETLMMKNFIIYGSLFIIMLGLLWKDLISVAKSFKTLRTIVQGLSYGGLIIAATVAYNLIVMATGYSYSENQNETALVSLMLNYPVLSFAAFVIIGPIVEEFTYRLGLFSFLRRLNRPLAYVVTMLVFGVIHMSFNPATIINELINLPSYIIAGVMLTYAYEKEGFAVSTYAHITNNLVSFLLTITRG
ncbi:MAG: type II CAAX endopeptidase family protein [Bacilli bacterium]|jgi:hypothetical protein